MVVVREALEMSVQAALAEYNHVIEAFAANGADHSFDIRALPWGSRGRQHLLDTHRIHLIHKVLSKDAITVPQQILWCTLPWKRFDASVAPTIPQLDVP